MFVFKELNCGSVYPSTVKSIHVQSEWKPCLNWLCQERKILKQVRYANLFSLGNCHWSLNEGRITFPQTSKRSLNTTRKRKSNSRMHLLCLYTSLYLSMGPMYFYAKHYPILQGIQRLYRERSWLPSSVFHLGGHHYPSQKGCVLQCCFLIKYNDLLWNIWGLPCLPCNPYAGWFSWVLERNGTHKDRTKVFSFLFLVVQVRQQRPSLLHCACVQGNCKVKKEQGPSSKTSGSFIFDPSWKHRDLRTL